MAPEEVALNVDTKDGRFKIVPLDRKTIRIEKVGGTVRIFNVDYTPYASILHLHKNGTWKYWPEGTLPGDEWQYLDTKLCRGNSWRDGGTDKAKKAYRNMMVSMANREFTGPQQETFRFFLGLAEAEKRRNNLARMQEEMIEMRQELNDAEEALDIMCRQEMEIHDVVFPWLDAEKMDLNSFEHLQLIGEMTWTRKKRR